MIAISLQKKLISADGHFDLNINLKFEEGHLITIFGESGAGKTSILRMISGLMKPDQGLIEFGDKLIFDSESHINTKIQHRNISYLSQDYSLFPNMTVKENLEYALKNKTEVRKVIEIMDLFSLSGLSNLKPDILSGGQKQRVALARALVQKPDLLLLDEPLSALDGKIRYELQEHVLKIKKEFNLTIIMVSHDVSEILRLADKVYVLKDGKINSEGKASDVFMAQNPAGKFQFTGEILKIENHDFLKILHVLIGKEVARVIAEDNNINYEIGDKVIISSKAFNPIIEKIK